MSQCFKVIAQTVFCPLCLAHGRSDWCMAPLWCCQPSLTVLKTLSLLRFSNGEILYLDVHELSLLCAKNINIGAKWVGSDQTFTQHSIAKG